MRFSINLENPRIVVRRAVEYFIAYMIYAFVSVGIHEYMHANVARMLGYKATVVFYWLEGYTLIQGFTYAKPFDVTVIAFSGGFLTAMIYMALKCMFLWHVSLPIIVKPNSHIVYQLIYSLIEVCYLKWWVNEYVFIVASTIVLSISYIYFLLRTIIG